MKLYDCGDSECFHPHCFYARGVKKGTADERERIAKGLDEDALRFGEAVPRDPKPHEVTPDAEMGWETSASKALYCAARAIGIRKGEWPE